MQFNCQRLFPQRALVAELFSSRLRELVPELRSLDPAQALRLSEGIIDVVLRSALTQEPILSVERSLARLGQDHRRQGFPREGYQGAGHALLRTARTITDSGWSSELSSAWVAYYSWLADRLAAGADCAAQEQDAREEDTSCGEDEPLVRSLDDVLPVLSERYFATNARRLESVCTRVMLRTGVDLRAPRPDQRLDAAALADVLTVLTITGYALPAPAAAERRDPPPVPVPGTVADRTAAPAFAATAGPVTGATEVGRRQGWIHRLTWRGRR